MTMRREFRAIISIFLALAFIITIAPSTTRAEWEGLELLPSRYTGNYTFVPGETVEMVLHATPGELYNVTIVPPGTQSPVENKVENNVLIDDSGTATVHHEIGETTPDGEYILRIRQGTNLTAEHRFQVQAYKFDIETDRDAYLVGDEMKIFWTANNLRDQTLPADGYVSIDIWSSVTDENNVTTHSLLFHTADISPAGSTSFEIPPTANKNAEYFVEGWFNDTQAFAKRHQYAQTSFTIKYLGVILDLDKDQYALGSLMFINLRTVVTNNASTPKSTDTGEPGCQVEIAIYEENDYSESKIPGGTLTTDSHGNLQYIIQLNPPIFNIDVTNYIVEIQASKWDKAFNSRIEARDFTITNFPSITALLDFDQDRYTSGESLSVNVTAQAIGTGQDVSTPTFTYLYEVRDTNATGDLFARETKTINSFSYDIIEDFTGTLWIQVTVDDGEGNTVSVIKFIPVDYAFVLVNLNKITYLANEELTISYDVVSTLLTSPSIFYDIRDAEGSVVKEGYVETAASEFSFTVPDPASDSYEFTVHAIDNGIRVEGKATARLFTGYVLTLSFNKATYTPGNTMAVDYEIIPLGDSSLPSTFRFTFGLLNGPEITYQTQSATGRLIYKIPEDIDEGDQIFYASADIGGSASEVITIESSSNPLWENTIFGMPLISFFVLVVAFFSLFIAMRQRKTIKSLKYGKILDTKQSSDRRHSTSGAAMEIECESCEKPIEVTTSRRPIEVMCPHCGEIQMLE